MASAVHEATIVSSQISGELEVSLFLSLSVYQCTFIIVYLLSNKRSALWCLTVQNGSLFQTQVPED